jgi:hypothetical protein
VVGRRDFYIGSWAGWAKWVTRTVLAHGPRRARVLHHAWAGSSTSPILCSHRPEPDNIVLGSCSCRAKKSCFGLTNKPRAKWPSIEARACPIASAHAIIGRTGSWWKWFERMVNKPALVICQLQIGKSTII